MKTKTITNKKLKHKKVIIYDPNLPRLVVKVFGYFPNPELAGERKYELDHTGYVPYDTQQIALAAFTSINRSVRYRKVTGEDYAIQMQ